MRKALFFMLLSTFVYSIGKAQSAGFTYTVGTDACRKSTVHFTDVSTGESYARTYWDFGDGTDQYYTYADPNRHGAEHVYKQKGSYLVTFYVYKNGGSYDIADSLQKTIVIEDTSIIYAGFTTLFFGNDTCNSIDPQDHFVNASYGAAPLSYVWNFGDGQTSAEEDPGHYFAATDTVELAVSSSDGCRDTGRSVLYPTSFWKAYGVPSKGKQDIPALFECTDLNGWTNYYETEPGRLLLSIKKNGNDIGTIKDGTFSLQLHTTAGAGSGSGVLLTNPLIGNSSGYWVMNRYWEVHPTHQPATPVGVRFYFTDEDLADVNGSYPAHNLDYTSLLFYKTVGGNPDPTTNLQGAERIISIANDPSIADTTHWVYTDLTTAPYNNYHMHMAEFQVSSFSGGGGGATGNGQVLPVQLTSFTAANNSSKVSLQWITAQEINVSKYNVQVSADGRQFITLGTVAAHGKTSPDAYAFTYNETSRAQAYYRLQIVEKNGTISGSNVVFLSFAKAGSIVLYPNPAKNSVQIKAAGFNNKWITADVYNTAGIKVSTTNLYFTAGTATLNTSALASGHYTVALRDERNVTHIPLVILQ